MNPSVREIVRRRTSVRRYTPQPLTAGHRSALEALCAGPRPGPFEGETRFRLLELGAEGRVGTYGFVRGARAWLAGAAEPGPRALERYGCRMEWIVLQATALGLGTCWLGGTFRRSTFAGLVGLREGELLPAVSPVGLPSGRSDLLDTLIRRAVAARSRRPWEELFFRAAVPLQVLDPEEAGPWREPLEAVRLAPSASNGQPWRVVREEARPIFHFFAATGSSPRFRRLDLGIAVCHFDLCVEELGLRGVWSFEAPGLPVPAGWEHVATWEGTDE